MKKGAIFMMIVNVCMAFTTPECGPVSKLYANDTSAYILVKKSHGIELFEKWDSSGKWILTKKTKGIQVEYFITTTPSKILPAWMTDPIIRNNLLSTMKEFREILEK